MRISSVLAGLSATSVFASPVIQERQIGTTALTSALSTIGSLSNDVSTAIASLPAVDDLTTANAAAVSQILGNLTSEINNVTNQLLPALATVGVADALDKIDDVVELATALEYIVSSILSTTQGIVQGAEATAVATLQTTLNNLVTSINPLAMNVFNLAQAVSTAVSSSTTAITSLAVQLATVTAHLQNLLTTVLTSVQNLLASLPLNLKTRQYL